MERLLAKCAWKGDCLVWTGNTVRGKYGTFRPSPNSADPKAYVHRYVYENTVGPIPEGMELDHVRERGCTTGLCVNPEHLEVVTHAENLRRARLRVCRAGLHDLTVPENVVWDKKGNRRGCLQCKRSYARSYARRKVGQ